MARFVVVEGSLLGHGCCYSFTICDTSKPSPSRPGEVLCEAFDRTDADAIAHALNAVDDAAGKEPEA